MATPFSKEAIGAFRRFADDLYLPSRRSEEEIGAVKLIVILQMEREEKERKEERKRTLENLKEDLKRLVACRLPVKVGDSFLFGLARRGVFVYADGSVKEGGIATMLNNHIWHCSHPVSNEMVAAYLNAWIPASIKNLEKVINTFSIE